MSYTTSLAFQIGVFDPETFDVVPVPLLLTNVIFQGDTFQFDTFQFYIDDQLVTNLNVSLSESRQLTYAILAKNDTQALAIAKSINPTSNGLPVGVSLMAGPQQRAVNVDLIMDSSGGIYPTDEIQIDLLPTPSISFVPPIVVFKLYLVIIRDDRHVDYSLLTTPAQMPSVVGALNPGLNIDPTGGRAVTPPTSDVVSVINVIDVTGGTNRSVYVA